MARLPLIYVSKFQKFNLSSNIKQSNQPLQPHALLKLLKSYKKKAFLCFAPRFALLFFQPCCGTDLKEISRLSLK